MSPPHKFLWTLATISSAGVALFSYRYLGHSDTRSPEVLANPHATPWLVLHVVGSATALLFGSFQLVRVSAADGPCCTAGSAGSMRAAACSGARVGW